MFYAEIWRSILSMSVFIARLYNFVEGFIFRMLSGKCLDLVANSVGNNVFFLTSRYYVSHDLDDRTEKNFIRVSNFSASDSGRILKASV